MILDSSKLTKGQLLKVDLTKVQDRLPKKLIASLQDNPIGELIGYKMVDGNQFGLVLKLDQNQIHWFFEAELSLVTNDL